MMEVENNNPSGSAICWRIYRSLLTVTICLGLLFQYSQPNKSVDQFVADLAD
jgi:hypothetical protein